MPERAATLSGVISYSSTSPGVSLAFRTRTPRRVEASGPLVRVRVRVRVRVKVRVKVRVRVRVGVKVKVTLTLALALALTLTLWIRMVNGSLLSRRVADARLRSRAWLGSASRSNPHPHPIPSPNLTRRQPRRGR